MFYILITKVIIKSSLKRLIIELLPFIPTNSIFNKRVKVRFKAIFRLIPLLYLSFSIIGKKLSFKPLPPYNPSIDILLKQIALKLLLYY